MEDSPHNPKHLLVAVMLTGSCRKQIYNGGPSLQENSAGAIAKPAEVVGDQKTFFYSFPCNLQRNYSKASSLEETCEP